MLYLRDEIERNFGIIVSKSIDKIEENNEWKFIYRIFYELILN